MADPPWYFRPDPQVLETYVYDNWGRLARRQANAVRREARRLAPRRQQGRSRRGYRYIRWEYVRTADGAEIRVGPSGRGFYLGLVETGTSHASPHPWLRPALDVITN